MAKIILFSLLVLSVIFPSKAATYYISASGNDANAGTSIATPWRSIARVNSSTFKPGDKILFEGGQTFQGGIWLGKATQGTAAQPIVVGSYGTSRADISS